MSDPSHPSTADRISDLIIVLFIALGLSMPIAFLTLAAFWAVGQLFSHTIPFTFSSYAIVLGFYTVMIWAVWVVDLWRREREVREK